MSSGSFINNVTYKTIYLQIIYIHIYIYIYREREREREDLALNNLQWLICHKTQPTNQTLTM